MSIGRRPRRFVIAGAGATLTHVAVATVLIEAFGASPGAANAVAYGTATLVSYVVNTLWTFSSSVSRRTIGRFLVSTLLLMLMSVGIASAVDAIGLSYYWGIGCIVVIVPVVTFLAHSKWTYVNAR